MQIGTDTTDTGGMKLTVTYGPTLVSVIFDPDDEDIVIKHLKEGFAEAKARRVNGYVQPD